MAIATTLSAAFLITFLAGATADFWIFGAGLIAGAVIVIALRRDIPQQPWDGRNRRAK